MELESFALIPPSRNFGDGYNYGNGDGEGYSHEQVLGELYPPDWWLDGVPMDLNKEGDGSGDGDGDTNEYF